MNEEDALKILLKIPKGKVITYMEFAGAAKTSPRAAGQILRRNRNPGKYPCYRVIMSNGRIGSYLGKKYSKKGLLLRIDGIEIKNGKVDLSRFGWRIKGKK